MCKILKGEIERCNWALEIILRFNDSEVWDEKRDLDNQLKKHYAESGGR